MMTNRPTFQNVAFRQATTRTCMAAWLARIGFRFLVHTVRKTITERLSLWNTGMCAGRRRQRNGSRNLPSMNQPIKKFPPCDNSFRIGLKALKQSSIRGGTSSASPKGVHRIDAPLLASEDFGPPGYANAFAMIQVRVLGPIQFHFALSKKVEIAREIGHGQRL